MGIYSKLLEIQRSVRALLPNADGNNYKYISGSKVLGIVRPKMDELGVTSKRRFSTSQIPVRIIP